MRKDNYMNMLFHAALLLLMGIATPASAQDVENNPDPSQKLTKDADGYYLIDSDAEFELFRQIVATGNPYANAKLTHNVQAKKPIGGGDEQFHYRGTFDGQGFTIDVDSLANDNENHPWGLFQFTEPGCVIKNLMVTGKLTSGHEYLGAIVGEAVGTRIENCISDAKLKNTSSTLPYTGGLIGGCHGVNFVENCAFIGEINAPEKACGLIGFIDHNVEIKSCYVDVKFENYDPAKHNLYTEVNNDANIFLNNYYHENGWMSAGKNGATVVSDTELKEGKLCHNLNVNGRNGVVWYQHDIKDEAGNVVKSLPYPFKGTDGKMVYKSPTSTSDVKPHVSPCTNTEYTNHICQECGEIEPGCVVEPLQIVRSALNSNNEITINNLKFKINKNLGTAEVRGYLATAPRAKAKAIHIPETIVVNGAKYTIDYIYEGAFDGSDMEYCYIPKTVAHISNNAFDNCDDLTYLHIADAAPEERVLWMGEMTKPFYQPDEPLFGDTKLNKVYLGRNITWNPESGDDAPFEDMESLNKVYFGPRVTIMGNAGYSDHNEGWNDETWAGSNKITHVFFMGDEASLNTSIDVEDCRGLGEAANYYINRNINYSTFFTFTSGPVPTNGCLDHCKHVAYGPFVKKITEKSFEGVAVDNNTTLESVDFTNAFRLEEIGQLAFAYCHKAGFARNPFKNCKKLRKIGAEAFTDCDGIRELTIPNSVTEIYGQAFDDCDNMTILVLNDGDEKITFYGGAAFNNCDDLTAVYHGRNFEYEGKSPYEGCKKVNTFVIGPKVTKLNYNGYKDMKNLGALSFLYSPTPLVFEDLPDEVFYNTKPRSMFIDRELKRKSGGSETEDLQFGENFKKFVKDLSFGDHITSIPARRFEDFLFLSNLVVPQSVKTIGNSAFKGCESLNTVSVLGDVTIGAEAFSGSTNMRHLFLMGQNIYLGANAFAGCNNIEEVATGFEADPIVNSDYTFENAFAKETYAKAHLMCAADTEVKQVPLTSIPWKLFQERKSLYVTNNYDEGIDSHFGDYEHASVTYKFDKDKYEYLYVPFDIDSYYFGGDAEIYKLDLWYSICDHFDLDVEYENDYKFTGINLKKYDIDQEKVLTPGYYLIKTKYPADVMTGFHTYFDSQLLYIDNGRRYAANDSNTDTYVNPDGSDHYSISHRKSFVVEDGVLKYINGYFSQYTLKPNSVLITYDNYTGESYEPVYSIKDDNKKVLLTSKIDIPFSQKLDGCSTFYAADCNYVAPEWCKVYAITSAKDGEKLELVEITDRTITKGQAALLWTANKIEDEELIEHLTYATNASTCSFEGNLLKGVDEEQTVSQLECESAYILDKRSPSQGAGGSAGFYKASPDQILTKGMAYLDADGLSSKLLDKSCIFQYDPIATNIKPADKAECLPAVYDLLGRRLKEAGYKGIYIVNGKKVVIK